MAQCCALDINMAQCCASSGSILCTSCIHIAWYCASISQWCASGTNIALWIMHHASTWLNAVHHVSGIDMAQCCASCIRHHYGSMLCQYNGLVLCIRHQYGLMLWITHQYGWCCASTAQWCESGIITVQYCRVWLLSACTYKSRW